MYRQDRQPDVLERVDQRFTEAYVDPAPLSARQLWALLSRAVTRELTWGLPSVAREVAPLAGLAASIPDPPIRDDALSALARKRGQTDGAALFSTSRALATRALLRLLVAYQIIWDYLDSVNERGAAAGQTNGRQLHLALVDALDPARPISDYYSYHPWQDDGGYLRRAGRILVGELSRSCLRIERVRPLVVREASRAQVLAINTISIRRAGTRSLGAGSTAEFPEGTRRAGLS